MSLRTYNAKRNFSKTAEPSGNRRSAPRKPKSRAAQFVIQKHDASHLHYDFRLELDGVLKSWAVPKGPSLDPRDRVLAVEVEDHPLDYATFEGTIPKGQYGGGTVLLWDRGTWQPVEGTNARDAYRTGKLKFTLNGEKLHGIWNLVRMANRNGSSRTNWLLIKEKDEYARAASTYDIRKKLPLSVKSGRDLPEITEGKRSAKPRTVKTTKAPSRRSKPQSSDPGDDDAPIPGAVRRSQPPAFSPQLATLADTVPEGDDWLHEVKFDGYRILAFIDESGIRLFTRNAIDWTKRFAPIQDAVEKLEIPAAILDGEIVALNDHGISEFQGLQRAIKEDRAGSLTYFVFDLPFWNGWDLRACALIDRQSLLAKIIKPARRAKQTAVIRLSEHIQGKGLEVLKHACRHRLEGIVAKRADSPYESKRNANWIKVKCGSRQELVVGGFTDPRNSREGFGSLLLGHFTSDGRFTYAGRVGSGFDTAELGSLIRKLKKLETKSPAYDPVPTGPDVRGAHWVKPQIVVEVSFTEWTSDGRLRHPVYQGLREDKDPADVKRERARHKPAVRPVKGVGVKRDPSDVADVTISHPERVVYPELEITKRQVAEYYAAVADWIMPHAADRPLSIVRCPNGAAGQCFFQKHLDIGKLKGVRSVPIEESKGVRDYLVVTAPEGFVSLVQMNCLELHAWGARASNPDAADRIVFDLDPGQDVTWPQICAVAVEVRKLLEQVGLRAFAKTSGGKGLHVVVPLSRRADWDLAKSFSRAVAEHIAERSPDRAIATMSKSARTGRVFIDYLRNSRGATSVLPFSTRARSNAGVSMPVAWTELKTAKPHRFTLLTVPKLLRARRSDPWREFDATKQSLSQSMLHALSQAE